MIGYQLYAKFCKNNSKIDGFENKAFDDDNEDYPEKDYPVELKQENKYASKLWLDNYCFQLLVNKCTNDNKFYDILFKNCAEVVHDLN